MNTMQQIGDLIGRKFALIGTADEVETEEDSGYKEVIIDGVRFYEVDTKPEYVFARDKQQVCLTDPTGLLQNQRLIRLHYTMQPDGTFSFTSFPQYFAYSLGGQQYSLSIDTFRSNTGNFHYYFVLSPDQTAAIPLLMVRETDNVDYPNSSAPYYIPEVAALPISKIPSNLLTGFINILKIDRYPCVLS